VISSSSSHATVTYTLISSALDSPPWGFPLVSESDHEAPEEPLSADASPTAISPGYIADSEPIEDDFEEDPEMDHVDYVDEEEEESFNDEEEKEEHVALTNSDIPIPDSTPSSEETLPFETDESTATPPSPLPRSPYIAFPLPQTGLRRARKTIRPQLPMTASMEALIAEYAFTPTPPLAPPSPLSPLSFPLT
ncbi:hypothetical protein Tco_0100404, partial [Tanacetum coccineum]